MFDCVMPTRIARNGTLYTSQGRVNIKAARYEYDDSPLDPNCGCYVCKKFTKSYLRHIYRMGEIASLIYNSYHNLYFMKNFMDEIINSIQSGTFSDVCGKWGKVY
jgi:queuine tRNA-ribosyltransferase